MKLLNENTIIKASVFIITAFMIGITAFFLSYGIVYEIMSFAPQENAERALDTVKVVCDESFNDVHNRSLEVACGNAQDTAKAEYICVHDFKTSADCSVEDKSKDW